MFAMFRLIAWVGIVSLPWAVLTGCEEKRIHVSTLSGTNGGSEAPDSMSPAELSGQSDQDGLGSSNLNESDLSGASEDSLASAQASRSADTSSPSDAYYPWPEDLDSDQAGKRAGGSVTDGIPGFPLSDGARLHAQSGSADSDVSTEVPHSEENSTEPMSSASGQFSDHDGDVPGEFFNPGSVQETDLEKVPSPLQVAKVEPSEALREQLDKMKTEELASARHNLEDVFFQFDSWSLTDEGKLALERNLGLIRQTPNTIFVIEGHADQRGTQAYNIILGKKRALAIREYLNQLGVDPLRLSVISYGKDKPFCVDQTEVCHQLNRRGHLLVKNP
jgi:outer membrane protein OmpA-like peptidoglycan-associated protein